MTKEDFNSLPLEARNFIQENAGCLSCGNTEAKLANGYALYLNFKKMTTYILMGGGVNFSQNGKTGVLRAISTEDTPFEIREKAALAKAIYASSPHLFLSFDELAINVLLESLPKDEVVDLGFNVGTASYEELKTFVSDNGIKVKGNASKKELIKAIEALEDIDGNELL
jgi:hypothetical protein